MKSLLETVPVFTGENLTDGEGTYLGDGEEVLRKDQVMLVISGQWRVPEPDEDDNGKCPKL